MKTIIIVLSIFSTLFLVSCKGGSSENQGYDSGPTTESESGSATSEGQNVTTDTTSTNPESETKSGSQ